MTCTATSACLRTWFQELCVSALLAGPNLAQVLLQNEAGARLWIDTIFFRVSAMLSGGKRMVLNLEQHIPSVGVAVPGQTRPLKITGTVDYAALMTDSHKHRVSSLSVHFVALRLLRRVIR